MSDDKVLLVICASRTGSNRRLVDAFVEGAGAEGIEGVRTRVLEPLDAGPDEVQAADGIVLAGPPRLGMIAGLMKDFLERIYYPCLDETVGLPYAIVMKGDTDATGALDQTQRIVTGLQWQQVQPPLVVIGEVTDDHLEAARELGATLAGGLSVELW